MPIINRAREKDKEKQGKLQQTRENCIYSVEIGVERKDKQHEYKFLERVVGIIFL
jgi:hypothetical protein